MKMPEISWPQVLAAVRDRPYLAGVPYWVAGGLVGILAVLYAAAFSGAHTLVLRLLADQPYLLFLTSPVCFVLSAWVVEKYAPAAAGTGIPQVKHAVRLDSETHAAPIHDILALRVCFVVMVSSLLSVLGAGALGREGPMVHIAACLFYFVGRSFSPVWRYEEHRSWIVAGGAAGVAAAFNAPLAGVVFVLEELAEQHFAKFKTVVISSAIVGGIVSQWLTGKYLVLGYPRIGEVPFSSVPWAVLVGLFCGVFAWPFHRLLSAPFQAWYATHFASRWKFAAFLGLMVAGIAVFVSPRCIGGGIPAIDAILFDGEEASLKILLGRFAATLLTHLSGAAGGFLAPALALGATMGSLLAQWTDYASHNLMVLVGMAAFLSAVIRSPFTAWVIVMEMTDRHSAIFPLMVASLVSYGTVRILEDRLNSLANPPRPKEVPGPDPR